MKKYLLFVGVLLQACGSESVIVKNEDMALKKVIQSINKHKLTSLQEECLLFISNNYDDFYEIEVREKHNNICGGDPQTEPRLFTYEVNKKTGKMQTDEPVWSGEKRQID